MPTITRTESLATVINVFTVPPEEQRRVAEMLVDTARGTVKDFRGFLSASVHLSVDGTRVANYAQWRSREELEAALQNPQFQEHIKPITDIAKPDAHVYEVVGTASASRNGAAAPVVLAEPDISSRPHQLTVEREIAALPSVLYRAWTEEWDRWFAAPGTWLVDNISVNSPFFFETHHEGQRYAHYGRFLRLERDKRIMITWVTSATKGAETVVSVALSPAASKGSRLRLTHAGFPDEESKRAYENGWTLVLKELDEYVKSRT